MLIHFTWRGLALDAVVNYTPPVPARRVGHPDTWADAEGGLELVTLTHGDDDAAFLLESGELFDELDRAAAAACAAKAQQEAEEAAAYEAFLDASYAEEAA